MARNTFPKELFGGVFVCVGWGDPQTLVGSGRKAPRCRGEFSLPRLKGCLCTLRNGEELGFRVLGGDEIWRKSLLNTSGPHETHAEAIKKAKKKKGAGCSNWGEEGG